MTKPSSEIAKEVSAMVTEMIDEAAGLKIKKKYLENNLKIFRLQWWIGISNLFGGGLLGFAFKLSGNESEIINNGFQHFTPSIIIGGILGIILYSVSILIIRSISLRNLAVTENKLAKLGVTDPKEDLTNDEQFYTRLIQINFKYTEEYYAQTQEQADKSFRLSAFAAISGLCVIIIGIIMMYSNISENDKTPSYVTTSAGILSEFIAAIFFYLYTQTILKMSQYHKKLLMTQNINLAMRIADKIDDAVLKRQTFQVLIDRLTADINKYMVEEKN